MNLREETDEDERHETVMDEKPNIPPDSLVVGLDPLANSKSSNQPPFMLLLIGIPGSGKSTLAQRLQKAQPYKFVRVNQDDLGNRKKCEDMTKQVVENGLCPVIDRCNFDTKQRKHFLDIAKNAGLAVDCVIFETPVEECLRRCQTRSNHPTLQPSQAWSVVKRMVYQLRLPQNNATSGHWHLEKFRTMYYIGDTQSFDAVLQQLLNDL